MLHLERAYGGTVVDIDNSSTRLRQYLFVSVVDSQNNGDTGGQLTAGQLSPAACWLDVAADLRY